METVYLKPEPLTAAAFKPFGDVIETSDTGTQFDINYGNTVRFHDLCKVDVGALGGRAIVSIFRTRPAPQAVQIDVMERHPLGSQAFIPLDGQGYLVIVAPPSAELDPAAIKVFVADGSQGVNYAPGTWHHYSLALEVTSNFAVIDRAGEGNNCDEVAVSNDAIRYLIELPEGPQ